MPETNSGPGEIARFVARRPPFDVLSTADLGGLISEAEIEFHPAGTTISGGPFVRVVHSGALDLADARRRLGPGDTLPAESRAIAAQDALCYRIPEAAAGPLLDQPRTSPARPVAPHLPAPPRRNSTRRSLGRPWREERWCAIDLELTGLDPRHDHIVALGAVPIESGRVRLGGALYTLVRTARPSGTGALMAHKLRPEDLEGAPTVDEAFELLLGALSGHQPVFHTAVIERSFLGPLFARHRTRLPNAADTQVLGRLWLHNRGEPSPAGLPLTRLARALGQDPEEPHHALADALMTALAFIALAAHLDAFQPQTVGRLVRAEDRFRGSLRFAPG